MSSEQMLKMATSRDLCTHGRHHMVASSRFDDPDALARRASVLLGEPPSPKDHGVWGTNCRELVSAAVWDLLTLP